MHKVILRDWLPEYELFTLSYKLIYATRRLKLRENGHNWPTEDESSGGGCSNGELSIIRESNSDSAPIKWKLRNVPAMRDFSPIMS
jgi:hypothetical protein